MDDKSVGLILAIVSSILIGCSFVLTKKGLMDAAKQNGGRVGELGYLNNIVWWVGLAAMVGGEAANFAAYSFAPAILVTPLGAGSVLLGAILAHFFLDERLGTQGTIGCSLCIIGSVIIVLHSPQEKKIESVEEILSYVMNPGFVLYVLLVLCVSMYLIYKVSPLYGKKNMLVYLTICSLVGSISVMAAKGFGIAIKLTLAGNNQFFYPSTYIFGITVAVCAITQINYFNKALEIFSTNRVTPIYYVFFTTATIIASILLFEGLADTTNVELVTALLGFITIFIGVFQLNSGKDAGGFGILSELNRDDNVEERRTSFLERLSRPYIPEAHLLNTFNDEEVFDDETGKQ